MTRPETMTKPVTVRDVLNLARVLDTAIHEQKVARVLRTPMDDFTTVDVAYGTARSVGDENGQFLANERDVRDMHLRVTLRGGSDVVWPLRELMHEVESGEFGPYNWDGVR